VLCNEGYSSSSLAAAKLRELGLQRATALVGGYHPVVEGIDLETCSTHPTSVTSVAPIWLPEMRFPQCRFTWDNCGSVDTGGLSVCSSARNQVAH